VKEADLEWNINFISNLLQPELTIQNGSLPFRERTFGLLPELKEVIKISDDHSIIKNKVAKILKDKLYKDNSYIKEKVYMLQIELDKLRCYFLPELLQLFEIDWLESEPYITCYLGCCPVFPRKVVTKELWINYSTILDKALAGVIHEIDHFVLFNKWKSIHSNELVSEPEHPEVLWFLEEIAVEPTLNEPTIKKLLSYPQKAYSQFYTEKILGKPLIEHIMYFYQSRVSMADFLNMAYGFILANHTEIVKKCG
jgi:hypothetical protein